MVFIGDKRGIQLCSEGDKLYPIYRKDTAMATLTVPARPDLAAHRKSVSLPWRELVQQLSGIIGRKLTAYIAGVKDVRAIDRWIQGGDASDLVMQRLRLAFQISFTLSEHDSKAVVQAWLTGINPELGDRVPLRLLREGDLEEVGPVLLGAVRTFLAGA